MKITVVWLKEKGACFEGIQWFEKQDKADSIEVLKSLIAQDYEAAATAAEQKKMRLKILNYGLSLK